MIHHPLGPMWTRPRNLFACDLRTLALFRVNVSLLVIADLALRSRDLVAHYTDRGVLPASGFVDLTGGYTVSLHLMSDSTLVQVLLFLTATIVAGLMLIGWHTRLMTVLSWFLLLSLQNRNHLILQGGDDLLVLLLFWGMFLPLGARLSIDDALGRVPENLSPQHFSVGTVAILLQCMSVYFFTAILKSSPVWGPEGSAVFYALHLDTFTTPLGDWLATFPEITRILTHYVWWLEILAPFLVFSPLLFLPLRYVGLVLLVSMHVGFLLCLNLGLFPLISITSLLLFLPSSFWDAVHRRIGRRVSCRLGGRVYGWIDTRRQQLSAFSHVSSQFQSNRLATSRGVNAVALFFLAVITASNLDSISVNRLIPARIADIYGVLGLRQNWSMFAPKPGEVDQWLVPVGVLENGLKVDLRYDEPREPFLGKPESFDETYRWRKLISNTLKDSNKQYREPLAAFLCRRWNDRNVESFNTSLVVVYVLTERTIATGNGPLRRRVYWHGQCPAHPTDLTH